MAIEHKVDFISPNIIPSNNYQQELIPKLIAQSDTIEKIAKVYKSELGKVKAQRILKTRKAFSHLKQNDKNKTKRAEDISNTFHQLGIVLFVLALLSFFIVLFSAAIELLIFTKILSLLSIVFLGIGTTGNDSSKNDNNSVALVIGILGGLLLMLSALVGVFNQYP